MISFSPSARHASVRLAGSRRFGSSLVGSGLLLALGLLLIGAAPRTTLAQSAASSDTSQTQLIRLELTDGSELVGRIVSESETELVFRTASGTRVTVNPANVKSRDPLNGTLVDGRFVRADPLNSRLFVTQTGRPLGHGNVTYTAYQVVFQYVSVGIGSRVNLSGGTLVLPGAFFRIFYFNPQVTLVNQPKLHASVGTQVLGVRGDDFDDGGYGGLLQGTATFGGLQRSVTTGLGFAYGDGEFESQNPAVILGGELQLGNNTKLITENYVILGVDDGQFFSGGVRFFSDKIAGSLGLATSPDLLGEDTSFPFVPILTLGYNF